jgi:tripartite-type tricarboxylate transporter receptor subunit TctC
MRGRCGVYSNWRAQSYVIPAPDGYPGDFVKLPRMNAGGLVSLLVLSLAAACVQAQPYPTKTVRLLVGYSPGGGTDVLSRVLAKYLSESFKQSVVVENRPGAGGILATELTAKAAPDGHTLMTTPSTHAINPGLYAKLPYDPLKDFTTIGLIATSPNAFVVHPSLPVKSVRDLIALREIAARRSHVRVRRCRFDDTSRR